MELAEKETSREGVLAVTVKLIGRSLLAGPAQHSPQKGSALLIAKRVGSEHRHGLVQRWLV